MTRRHSPFVIAVADDRDRQAIYAIRHDVYARELGQHAVNADRALTDALDGINTYLVARQGRRVVGFVAVTPPTSRGYSIDKYFDRTATGLTFDDGLYEVRLLTVVARHRRTQLAALLMYAALRYVTTRGATTLVAIGRRELLGLYERVGLSRRGLRTGAGAVTYELMAASVCDLPTPRWTSVIHRLRRDVRWRLPGVPFEDPACFHGGAFWRDLGDRFDRLERRDRTISADVLDAWFDPAPSVLRRLSDHLPFVMKTSPPTHAEGLTHAIAEVRGVPESAVLPGAGSSDLIFLALRHWIGPRSRVLILDPMYGEYAHLLERVVGASVDRLALRRSHRFDVDLDELRARLTRGYDWVVLVNPNSPTGRHIERHRLLEVLADCPPTTRVWIDETYVDYAGAGESLEACAAGSPNAFVCKSMSKAYALSGIRAAYLVGPATLLDELRPLCPPWSLSLAAQLAACEALRATDYYESQWRETRVLRAELQRDLESIGWNVTPGCANFLLCELPASAPPASVLVELAQSRGLFLRDAASMGTGVGERAVRVAVKDRTTNARMIRILDEVMDAGLRTHDGRLVRRPSCVAVENR